MIRKNFWFTNEQIDFLESLKTLNLTEHIRRAVDDYIKKIKSEDISASQSKGCEKNG